MTISIAPQQDIHLGSFERFLERGDTQGSEQGPDWFEPTRRQAMDRFTELGLPTRRHEQWRFTDITPIRETVFEPAPGYADLSAHDLQAVQITGLDASRLVFVNGRFNAQLSNPGPMPEGVQLMSLAAAMSQHQDLVEPYLGRLADDDDDAFGALNTAMANDGLFLFVPPGASVDQPIHVLHIATPSQQPALTCPRHLIIAGQGAALTVVEDYVATHGGVYLTNAVTEIAVASNADVTHYLIGRDSDDAFNITSLYAHQGRDSRFTSHSVLLGGSIVRNNVRPVLDGENCYSLLNGLYIVGDRQTVDNHMRVDHAKPHGDSRQFYKGIMKGHAKGVFRGRIIVRPDAQKTDAKQSNQNLLLSDDASANTDPQLEIYADDVKCTHGATVGQINEDQVFYLRSRGISHDMARAMIVYAFAGESLERMSDEPTQRFLRSQVLGRLPASGLFAKSL